jgi:hypothetical protein
MSWLAQSEAKKTWQMWRPGYNCKWQSKPLTMAAVTAVNTMTQICILSHYWFAAAFMPP